MNKTVAGWIFSTALVAPAFSAETYTMDPQYTIPVFEVQHLEFTTQRGRFDKTEGKVLLDIPARKGVVAAEGQFTLLGVTKPLRVTVDRCVCATHPQNKKYLCAGDIAVTLKRSEFGMTKYIPTVSDDIKINVPVEAYRD